uniref:uncharacterized protein LOC122583708 n=1 Tax=Erigeron canadensis TaxID=72917 RepID=UPI001CB970D7|nr:uncharacterized protein LOC122583708 [Erigeron canadensis]
MASNTISEFAHLRIPLEEIVKATDNFADDNIIGKGGFGNVYKGKLMRYGRLIDISCRRLDRRHGQGDVEFWTEISMLGSLKHENIITIIGYCDEKNEKIIITYYYSKGSLSMHLSDATNLTWIQRLKISLGIVRAIFYLHENIGESYYVIHRNINSSTILLDDNWKPKLSGFEFSIKHSIDRKNHIFFCEAIGTRGYMDPEIEKTGGVTHKSDIYSLGVVLFELLCGRKAFDPKLENDMFLAPLAKFRYENRTLKDIINPDLRDQMIRSESIVLFSKAAYHCLQEERVQRSDATLVGHLVDQALQYCEMKDDDDDNDSGDGIGGVNGDDCHSTPLNYIYAILFLPLTILLLQVNGFGHLRIPLTEMLWVLLMATPIDSPENSSFDESMSVCEYVAEVLECFDRESMMSVEEMNKGEIPKRCYKVNIKQYKTKEHMFNKEIEILSSCKHRNIESLLGFCDETPDMILVFDFFPSSPLSDQLEGLLLTWEKRLKVCLEIAHGINYIHNEMEDQKMIIHRAICSDNILLGDNEEVKITGFRESLMFLPLNQADDTLYIENTNPKFNPYLDPQYVKTGKLKRESDVYSFGAVLFEILCGKSAYKLTCVKDGQEHELLSQVVRQWLDAGIIKKKIASVIMGENGENKFYLNKGPNEDSLNAFLKIAHWCLAETQNERPTMKVVIKELEKALSYQENNKDNFRMSFEEIKLATHDFSPHKLIGGGGFGGVYKGKVAHRHDNGHYTIVAKRLDTSHGQGEKQYYNELQILSEYKHDNVIGLVGYSNETNEKIIVYEHACKGSLDKYLNDVSLTWRNRLKICIDFATGLDFLHEGGHGKEVVIHRDIKAANILLFDDWKTKIGDFGLSIISTVNKEADYVIDHACGTKGYLDPLYLKSGFLTTESDIYSFGVVLFEILCGRSTFEIHKYEGQFLAKFIKHKFEKGKQDEMVSESIKEEITPRSLTTFQEIAYKCLDDDREKRPTAREVLTELKKALEFQEDTNIGAETS